MYHIIIPTYNREETIIRALKSVLKQKINTFIIYIIDDGSTDKTKVILDPYLKQYGNTIYYFYKKNGGVCSARNKGIELALLNIKSFNDDWIIFFDSDDELCDNALELINKEIFFYTNSSSQIFFFGSKNEYGKKTSFIYNNKKKLDYGEFISGKFFKGDFNGIIQLSLLKNNNYRFVESINGGEAIFWYKLLKDNLIYLSKYVIQKINYDSGNSLTRGYLTTKKIKNNILLNEYLIKYYKKDFIKYNIIQLSIFYFVLARMEALAGFRLKSFSIFLIGIKYNFDFKRIVLYFVSILPFGLKLNNVLIKLIK